MCPAHPVPSLLGRAEDRIDVVELEGFVSEAMLAVTRCHVYLHTPFCFKSARAEFADMLERRFSLDHLLLGGDGDFGLRFDEESFGLLLVDGHIGISF